jgi:hypothetical protein
LIANPNGRGFDLVPDVTPKLDIFAVVKFAHELAHSFPIGDEYGGYHTPISEADAAIEEATSLNLQARATLLTPDPATPAVLNLDPDKIKWNFPRVAKAGVLAAAVVTPAALPAGTRFRVSLETGHAKSFAVDDIVRLRKRPLLGAGDPSVRFRVASVPVPDVELEVMAGTAPTSAQLAAFGAGSSLILPVRGAASPTDPLGPDLTLMARAVRDHIATTRNPLNVSVGEPKNSVCTGQLYKEGVVVFPHIEPADVPGLRSGTHRLVGLFEGGSQHDCGLYHPTGACTMGFKPPDPRSEERRFDARKDYWIFCQVCRYVLVDYIDPAKHADIDQDFARFYPL